MFAWVACRVKCGSLDVIKGGIKLAILRTFDIFGEMSFLGRCRTSASIVANTYSEVIVMKVSFLTQIFAAGTWVCLSARAPVNNRVVVVFLLISRSASRTRVGREILLESRTETRASYD